MKYQMNITEVNNSVEKIKMYILEEEKILDNIKNKCKNLTNYYVSNEQNKLIECENNIEKYLDSIIAKRKKYSKTIEDRVENFEIATKRTIDIFESK